MRKPKWRVGAGDFLFKWQVEKRWLCFWFKVRGYDDIEEAEEVVSYMNNHPQAKRYEPGGR